MKTFMAPHISYYINSIALKQDGVDCARVLQGVVGYYRYMYEFEKCT